MLKAYKHRIYPNKKQKELMEKTFGCVRFYWNKALEIKLSIFKENIGKPKEERKSIPQVLPVCLKKDYSFFREVDSLALANAGIIGFLCWLLTSEVAKLYPQGRLSLEELAWELKTCDTE
ncbi:MAG: helix-turn-helix domain-containing protein [Candidatus Aenigmatarchaeota archaeon]